MEKFEILDRYANKVRPTEMGNVYKEKLLVRYKNSDIRDPVVLAPSILEDIDFIENFEVFEDDVFLAGFPRSGTTFTQELIWIILNNYDFEAADGNETYRRISYFE